MLAVVDHLVLSGKHNLIRPEAIVMADSHAEILFWCTEEPSDDEVVAVRSSKKSRGSAGGIDRLQEIADEAPAKVARVMELMHNSSKAIRTAEATCSQAAKALRDEANMLDKAHAELQQMHRK